MFIAAYPHPAAMHSAGMDTFVVGGSKHDGCHSSIKCGKLMNSAKSWTANVLKFSILQTKKQVRKTPINFSMQTCPEGVMQHFTGRLPDLLFCDRETARLFQRAVSSCISTCVSS